VREAESLLIGRKLTHESIERCAVAAKNSSLPITDVYGAAWYKAELVEALVKRAVLYLKKGSRRK
jgi:CO/xanthine dehydrogenase FAD-binding subunit